MKNSLLTPDGSPFHLGEHITIDVTFVDQDGLAINLTGAAITLRLATRAAKILDASIGSGIAIVDAPTGKAQIIISPAMQTTANMNAGDHLYEIKLVTAAGVVAIEADGLFPVADSLFRKYA